MDRVLGKVPNDPDALLAVQINSGSNGVRLCDLPPEADDPDYLDFLTWKKLNPNSATIVGKRSPVKIVLADEFFGNLAHERQRERLKSKSICPANDSE
jgi:hypothetical protein